MVYPNHNTERQEFLEANPIIDKRDLGAFIPSALDDFGLSPAEFRIYAHIVRRAGNGQCWDSTESKAKTCRLSTGTVKRAIRKLLDHNLIEKQSRPGKTTLYTLTSERYWIPLSNSGSQPNSIHGNDFIHNAPRKTRQNGSFQTQVSDDPGGGSSQTQVVDHLEPTKDIPMKEIKKRNSLNNDKGENLESSDQTKILPDLHDTSTSFAVFSSDHSFKTPVDNNSQQVAKESKKEKKPSLTEMMEAIPIKNKFPKRKIAEILIEEGCGIEDVEAVMAWVWAEVGATPHYQGKPKQIGLNLYFKDICNQRTYTDIDGNQSTGNGVSKQTVLELACEAVKAQKTPTENTNTSHATNTSHVNLTHDQKIAIKQINLALQKGDRSLAQSIAAKYGLNHS